MANGGGAPRPPIAGSATRPKDPLATGSPLNFKLKKAVSCRKIG